MGLELGQRLSVWAVAPFVLMLLSIAVLPMAAPGWFDRNRNKAIVALLLGLPTVVYLVAFFGGDAAHPIGIRAEDYVSFMVLLLTLYVISGGIYLNGNLLANPLTNLGFLVAGSLLANVIGTMGASMILVRPLLRTNGERTHRAHTIIFFIFCVANVGGLLTPLGDPPLFLGFLSGVPFSWTLHLWPQWLLALALILMVYSIVEVYQYRREPAIAKALDQGEYEPLTLIGYFNIVLLILVIVAVLLSGPINRAGEFVHFPFLLQIIMLALVALSLLFGPKRARRANHFRWGPIVEVAILFAGIFATMIPTLEILRAQGGAIGLTSPWQYYWATGFLSGFLDNAPTYLAFASGAAGHLGVSSIGALATGHAVTSSGATSSHILAAISCGAVMMGAFTYVGNAPNLVVKALAEDTGVKMPSFFGYMRYSLAVLIPIFIVITLVFFI